MGMKTYPEINVRTRRVRVSSVTHCTCSTRTEINIRQLVQGQFRPSGSIEFAWLCRACRERAESAGITLRVLHLPSHPDPEAIVDEVSGQFCDWVDIADTGRRTAKDSSGRVVGYALHDGGGGVAAINMTSSEIQRTVDAAIQPYKERISELVVQLANERSHALVRLNESERHRNGLSDAFSWRSSFRSVSRMPHAMFRRKLEKFEADMSRKLKGLGYKR